MWKAFLSSRLLQGTLIGLVLFCAGCLLYLQHVERENARDLARHAEKVRRYEKILKRTPQDTEGHWHGDEWHAAPPAAPEQEADDGEAVETEEPEAPPTLTRDELPEALPYPMTHANHHIWKALVTEAYADPELMQKLLPDTKEKAFETLTHLANSVGFEIGSAFEMAMWRKMAARYPNDPEVLFMHSAFLVPVPKGTRAEKEAYVALWERLKRLNDEQGIPLTSPFRKTHSLTQTYLDLGEYDKAIQNCREQHERLAALRSAGYHDRGMLYGILPPSELELALKRRHEAKQR